MDLRQKKLTEWRKLHNEGLHNVYSSLILLGQSSQE